MVRKAFFIALQLLYSFTLFCQEGETETKEEGMKGAHRFTVGLGHTHLAKGINQEGKKVWTKEPSWSINYDYWISNQWAIGLQSDFVLEEYIIEDNEGNELERERPIALVPVGIYKPFKHFSFIAGAGVELEKEKNLGLTRIGSEFGVEFGKGWEAGIALVWDAKWGHYDSWLFEFSFSKSFRKKN